MLIRSRHRPFSRGRTLITGALFLSAGCNGTQTEVFNTAAYEKAAAEKGFTGPGTLAKKAPPPTGSKTPKVPRTPGAGLPSPD
jgi:hypothetical protein